MIEDMSETTIVEITISEIKERKLRLELMIAEMLYNFSKNTSVDVIGLEFNRVELQNGHAVEYVVEIETML